MCWVRLLYEHRMQRASKEPVIDQVMETSKYLSLLVITCYYLLLLVITCRCLSLLVCMSDLFRHYRIGQGIEINDVSGLASSRYQFHEYIRVI